VTIAGDLAASGGRPEGSGVLPVVYEAWSFRRHDLSAHTAAVERRWRGQPA
jgi:hypothetical protein